jgi:uncharacterized membrane protein YgcG
MRRIFFKTYALFDDRALGRKTGGARGMLFLVDPQGKAVRLETGYDLEGIFILFRKG